MLSFAITFIAFTYTLYVHNYAESEEEGGGGRIKFPYSGNFDRHSIILLKLLAVARAVYVQNDFYLIIHVYQIKTSDIYNKRYAFANFLMIIS